MGVHNKGNTTRAVRSHSGEIKPKGATLNTESVRLPRNIAGQGRKGVGNAVGTRLKRT